MVSRKDSTSRLAKAGLALGLGAVALAPGSALAEIQVRSLKLQQGYVVLRVAPEDGVSKGSVLEGSNSGETCRLNVYFVKGTQAAATTRECPSAESISVGQVFALSDGSSPPPEAAPASGRRGRKGRGAQGDRTQGRDEVTHHHFGLHAYYSLASTIDEKYSASGTLNGSALNATFTNTYVTSSAPGAGLRYTFVERHSSGKPEFHLGGMGAFSFDLSRSITESTDAAGNRSAFTDLKLSVAELEMNLVGEYGSFYGFAGPNLSFLSVSGKDADPDRQTSGALGLQIGAGFRFGPVGIEGLYRAINGSVASLVEGVEVQTEQNRLWGLMLRFQVFLSK